MTPEDHRHGSVAGYQAHRRAGIPPCEPCREAIARYQRQRDYDRHLGRPRMVDALGVRRRIHALYALGWTAQHIAEAAGYKDGRSVHKITVIPMVNRSTHQRIDRAFRQLAMRPGPSAITRAHAHRVGYAPPLAWDDIDRDEKPQGVRRAA